MDPNPALIKLCYQSQTDELFERISNRSGSGAGRGKSGSDRRCIAGRKNSLYTDFFWGSCRILAAQILCPLIRVL